MLEGILIGGAGGTIAGLAIGVIQWLMEKVTERADKLSFITLTNYNGNRRYKMARIKYIRDDFEIEVEADNIEEAKEIFIIIVKIATATGTPTS